MHIEHDYARADEAFRRALELDPSDSLARFRYSHLLAIRGRLPDAIREASAARKADPLSAPIGEILSWYSYYSGADAEALQRMRQAADIDGNRTRFHAFAAYVYSVRRECDRAASELDRLPNGAEFPRITEAAFALARCGDETRSETLRQELIARRLAFSVAMVHFGRGETDAFYTWFNRAIDMRSPEVLYVGVDPAFTRERDDPRFQAALRRIGL
jgi:adenylate cyclase